MPLLYVRSRVPFHEGANATDVIINDVHFNLTSLNRYNYTLYSNGTLSNASHCYLTFNGYQPHMFSNGSFVNATSCYSPVLSISQRGSLGLTFGLLFALSVAFTVANLHRHGRRYLPLDTRFSLVGRRWKWYWLLFVAVCGTISCFMIVDVDRNYLQSAPLVLQSIFYTIMTPMLMASVWEGVRHWGSWQERQMCDRDPLAFTLPADDNTRRKQEIYLPLVFYAFAVLNFLLTVPRSWSPIQLQRSPQQEAHHARPTATDARFKAAGITGIVAVVVICYSLEHSIYRYVPRAPGRPLRKYLESAPSQFLVAIAILLVKVGYTIASAFRWSLSPMNADVHVGWLYGLGYTPVLLIIYMFNLCGACELNEDKALLLLRGERTPKKYKLKRKMPAWLSPSRWGIFTKKMDSGDDKRASDNIERYVEMGFIKSRPDDEVKGGAIIDVATSRSTSGRGPFTDDAGDSIDYVDEVRRPAELGDRRRASGSTVGDEAPRTEQSVLGA